MENALIVSRCSTNDNRQDVSRQSLELRDKYSNQYNIVKEFNYYKSGTMNDIVNAEIIDYAKNNDVKHIITIEISRISRKLSSFALFLENCNASGINIIIDNYKLHTLLDGKPNNMVQTMLSIASTFATMEVNILQQRLQSGRAKYIKGGGVLGRKIGSTKTDTELLKQHADIVKYLRQGLSIRTIAKITCKSGVTVQKLKKIIHTTS